MKHTHRILSPVIVCKTDTAERIRFNMIVRKTSWGDAMQIKVEPRKIYEVEVTSHLCVKEYENMLRREAKICFGDQHKETSLGMNWWSVAGILGKTISAKYRKT